MTKTKIKNNLDLFHDDTLSIGGPFLIPEKRHHWWRKLGSSGRKRRVLERCHSVSPQFLHRFLFRIQLLLQGSTVTREKISNRFYKDPGTPLPHFRDALFDDPLGNNVLIPVTGVRVQCTSHHSDDCCSECVGDQYLQLSGDTSRKVMMQLDDYQAFPFCGGTLYYMVGTIPEWTRFYDDPGTHKYLLEINGENQLDGDDLLGMYAWSQENEAFVKQWWTRELHTSYKKQEYSYVGPQWTRFITHCLFDVNLLSYILGFL
jgi:hypothetical protein